MRRWYVINTQVRAEETARFHIESQGFLPYLPRYLKRRSHARKVDWLPAPMFPQYLFVNLNPSAEQWRAIRSTIGVRQFICQGDQPIPVPKGIVEGIQAREDENGLVTLSFDQKFKHGEKVQVMHGAMANQVGIFDRADDQKRVFILLDVMGRQVKTCLPLSAIRVAS